jgi:hypothetical protein
MTDKFDWDNAVNEWQNHEPDMPALKKNMLWQSWRMKLVLALDIIGLLVLFPFAYFIFLSDEAMSIKVWFSLVCIIAAVGVYFDFYLRKDLWELPSTTKGVFRHLIKRAEAGIKIARFSIVYLSLFLLFLVGWGLYLVFFETERLAKAGSLTSLIIGSTVIVISIAVSIWYKKRKEMQLESAKKDYEAFIQPDID